MNQNATLLDVARERYQLQPKKQFKGTSAPRLFFDRRVRETGGTISVSLGKILPHNWYYIRLEVIDRGVNSVTVKFTKLLENEPHASDTPNSQASQQDT